MSDQTAEQKGPTQTEILLGGAKVTVQLNVPEGTANTKEVTVRFLKIKQYQSYQAAQEDEIAMIALLTGETQAWVETLLPDSHEQLIAEGERLNGDFFGRWAARLNKRRERFMPGITEALVNSIGKRVAAPSPDSSPKQSARQD